MKQLIFLITIIATTSLVRAGEIVPVWEQEWDIDNTKGLETIMDIEFIEGEDQFMFIGEESGIGIIEIRETATGEYIKSDTVNNIYEESRFEILPDSNRFIISVGGISDIPAGFEVRSLEDFSIINKFEVPLEGDTVTEEGNSFVNRIIDVKVDQSRPYVYFILEKALPRQSLDSEKEYYAIKTYNYETGEEVRELRSYKDDNMMIIDVSDDGRYLASINEREAYIYIWDLETFSQIRSYQLFRNSPDKAWRTDVRDMRFSELNSDIIYFSGVFSKIGNPDEFEGSVFEYSIERGNHINKLPDNKSIGRLIFAEDEKILFLNFGSPLKFFNMLSSTLEFKLPFELKDWVGMSSDYNSKFKFYLLRSRKGIKSIQYLTPTDIENQDQNDGIIYPNPTTNNIQIGTNCMNSEIHLELMDLNGSLLVSKIIPITDDYITFDLSGFPSGSYFIRLNCGEQVNTYNVIKEG